MTDSTVDAAAPAVTDDQPSKGTPAPPPAGDAQTAQAASAAEGSRSDDDVLSLDEARKLRRENASLRKRVSEYDQAKADAEQAGKSELERAQARIAELEQRESEALSRYQEQSLRFAVDSSARKMGFWDPDVVYGLIDRSAVEYDDSGAPKNIDRLLADIAKDKPRLVQQADFGGGPRGTTARASDMNVLIRKAAGR